ncbi:hypothetical protein PMZ80_003130 [Knufia obscura]|uniref:Uncharacterized protein n=2 Tax=Knufia TaxID=430999 RepID=A0AAN8F0J8_9EURO|nr:hypothetical protein PMZ80_003130 [Knufia obscura]KAK5949331.1 hypothetical protein OHC33_009684 [Knufia fluminis]
MSEQSLPRKQEPSLQADPGICETSDEHPDSEEVAGRQNCSSPKPDSTVNDDSSDNCIGDAPGADDGVSVVSIGDSMSEDEAARVSKARNPASSVQQPSPRPHTVADNANDANDVDQIAQAPALHRPSTYKRTDIIYPVPDDPAYFDGKGAIPFPTDHLKSEDDRCLTCIYHKQKCHGTTLVIVEKGRGNSGEKVKCRNCSGKAANGVNPRPVRECYWKDVSKGHLTYQDVQYPTGKYKIPHNTVAERAARRTSKSNQKARQQAQAANVEDLSTTGASAEHPIIVDDETTAEPVPEDSSRSDGTPKIAHRFQAVGPLQGLTRALLREMASIVVAWHRSGETGKKNVEIMKQTVHGYRGALNQIGRYLSDVEALGQDFSQEQIRDLLVSPPLRVQANQLSRVLGGQSSLWTRSRPKKEHSKPITRAPGQERDGYDNDGTMRAASFIDMVDLANLKINYSQINSFQWATIRDLVVDFRVVQNPDQVPDAPGRFLTPSAALDRVLQRAGLGELDPSSLDEVLFQLWRRQQAQRRRETENGEHGGWAT